MLSTVGLSKRKAPCSSPMSSWITFLSLEARALEIILYETLQKMIGLYSLGEERFKTLGISVT